MIDYTYIYQQLQETPLSSWVDDLTAKNKAAFAGNRWGDLPAWLQAVQHLPDIKASSVDLTCPRVRAGGKEDCSAEAHLSIERELRKLSPWRKGPFDVFGISVETEWRSDLKWGRFKDAIEPLKGRYVLDVGCGSGYHCFRMAGAGARLVCGIDPTMLYVVQFYALNKYLRCHNTAVFPLGIDEMPESMEQFDTAFSMGLLYHRRSPFDHLLQLKALLRAGGQLVLETLVIDGKDGDVLSPQDRYAKMPNVWFIPSVPTLASWLKRAGFEKAVCVDVTKTTPEEQRTTDWMSLESLRDFLDPQDQGKTVEGYPAPVRAVFLATKK